MDLTVGFEAFLGAFLDRIGFLGLSPVPIQGYFSLIPTVLTREHNGGGVL